MRGAEDMGAVLVGINFITSIDSWCSSWLEVDGMVISAGRTSHGVSEAVVDVVGVGWLELGVESSWDRVAVEVSGYADGDDGVG